MKRLLIAGGMLLILFGCVSLYLQQWNPIIDCGKKEPVRYNPCYPPYNIHIHCSALMPLSSWHECLKASDKQTKEWALKHGCKE